MFLTSFIMNEKCSIILPNKYKINYVILKLSKFDELQIISLRVPKIIGNSLLNKLTFIKQSSIKCSGDTSICFISKIKLIE